MQCMNSVWIVYAEVYAEVTFGETIDDALLAVRALERTLVHVGIKRQTCIRQHPSAYVKRETEEDVLAERSASQERCVRP